MSEARFTPGKWVSIKYGYEKYSIQDWKGTEIGFCHRPNDSDLIAAAPELYEALEDVLGLVPLEFEESPMVAFAKAALTKARGETL